MKKIIDKKVVITFIITAIFFTMVGVYAETVISGNKISYSNSESGLTSINVQGAIDELSTKTKAGDATALQILSGKKALVGGTLITGTMANNGALNKTFTTSGGSYTIPAGYTSGGTVTVPNTYSSEIAVDSELSKRGYNSVNSLETLKTAITNDNKSNKTMTITGKININLRSHIGHYKGGSMSYSIVVTNGAVTAVNYYPSLPDNGGESWYVECSGFTGAVS